jgi:alpha-beta hydrolase superfamily lysophospholipase
MKARIASSALIALVAAGTAGAAYRPSPLLPLDGAYRLADGTVLSLAVTPDGGLLYTNTRTGDLRQLSPPTAPGRFTFGPSYLVTGPVRGTITVKGPRLTLVTGGRTRTARRIAVKRQAVSFAGQGERLAGKVTSPATGGRHPAVAIVHGSEAGDRDYYDLLVNFYSSLGYVVLTFDKRGVGASKGVYQEFPSERNVENLAGDAIGALRVLATRKDVDASRIGLVGASQAGWIISRAAARSPLVRFAVVTSGPAMSGFGWPAAFGPHDKNPSAAPSKYREARTAPTEATSGWAFGSGSEPCGTGSSKSPPRAFRSTARPTVEPRTWRTSSRYQSGRGSHEPSRSIGSQALPSSFAFCSSSATESTVSPFRTL